LGSIEARFSLPPFFFSVVLVVALGQSWVASMYD
jgi:hypothetical protein